MSICEVVDIDEKCFFLEGKFEGAEFWNKIQSKWPGILLEEFVIETDTYQKRPFGSWDLDLSDFGASLSVIAKEEYFRRIK